MSRTQTATLFLVLLGTACGGSAFSGGDGDAGLEAGGGAAGAGGQGGAAGSAAGKGGTGGSGMAGASNGGGTGGAGGVAGAGGQGGTVSCGSQVCGPDEYCCSSSCGICAPRGGACPAIACFDAGVPPPDASPLPDASPPVDSGDPCPALSLDVDSKLATAQKCIPNGIVAECQDTVEGRCCPVVVANKSSAEAQDYLSALDNYRHSCPSACPAIACRQPTLGCQMDGLCTP